MKMRLLVLVSAAALSLTACSSDGGTSAPGPNVDKGSSQKLVQMSPLTGRALTKGAPANPVFVVKVENTDAGAPQYGLDKADLVIEELVEGGLTRLAAFYYSQLPSKVGHVRSMRATDIGIASPVGGQIVASGGAGGTYGRVKKAGITVFSEDHGAPGFSSDQAKDRPYNRLINLKTVAKKAKRNKIHAPYLPWTSKGSAMAPTAGAGAPKRARSATVAFSNSTRTQWALKSGKWQRTNGHASPGHDFKADTMIAMFCKVGDAGYTDPAGNPVPETKLKGRGRAVVFHGKDVTEVTWHKSSLGASITFSSAGGKPYTIDPGHVFLELVPKDGGSVNLG
ncbi:DUF3048 domain-containing protein [Aeromicrobium sp.]|uniref:DUF3048 domain-containing protein n=1 Tax=Aeromicrobium sp. TaxID=1871063 RepID=UPI0019A2A303|nr:DUF3048 domain-containing protein [Aeromicrobium sp.]MBC7633626.1 DUF3048 domain-containing protein [Aeromicrobium sp.]